MRITLVHTHLCVHDKIDVHTWLTAALCVFDRFTRTCAYIPVNIEGAARQDVLFIIMVIFYALIAYVSEDKVFIRNGISGMFHSCPARGRDRFVRFRFAVTLWDLRSERSALCQ